MSRVRGGRLVEASGKEVKEALVGMLNRVSRIEESMMSPDGRRCRTWSNLVRESKPESGKAALGPPKRSLVSCRELETRQVWRLPTLSHVEHPLDGRQHYAIPHRRNLNQPH